MNQFLVNAPIILSNYNEHTKQIQAVLFFVLLSGTTDTFFGLLFPFFGAGGADLLYPKTKKILFHVHRTCIIYNYKLMACTIPGKFGSKFP